MTDLTPYYGSLARRSPATIEDMIKVWLDAKEKRSNSTKTVRAYQDTLTSYRAALQSVGIDLDHYEPAALALAAQGWAGRDTPAPATYNQRLAIVSSFYVFVRKQDLLSRENPIARVERAKVHAYAGARGLDHHDVSRWAKQIDRSTLQGKRDYALLAIALQTGRRVQELAGLRWIDVHQVSDRVTLTWRRTKGGKVMSDTLPKALSRALMEYLQAQYGARLGALPSDAPIWVSRRGGALSTRMISVLCEQHLGTSRVHTLRHTFARELEASGAKVSDIQARLGHDSLATTGRYLAALKLAENPYAETLASRFGFTEEDNDHGDDQAGS